MDRYKVKINPRAIRELDNIFAYIAFEKFSVQNARGQTERIRKAIMNLSTFPYAHQEREEGRYAGLGYRQLLIDNYVVIYRINESEQTVYIVTIQYQGRDI